MEELAHSLDSKRIPLSVISLPIPACIKTEVRVQSQPLYNCPGAKKVKKGLSQTPSSVSIANLGF